MTSYKVTYKKIIKAFLIMTDKSKKQSVNDITLNHDYFKIERVYPIKITVIK